MSAERKEKTGKSTLINPKQTNNCNRETQINNYNRGIASMSVINHDIIDLRPK